MKYNKLVRDRIPEIIASNKQKAITHVADDTEYEAKLLEKFGEEVKEIITDPNEEEIADLLELVHALCQLKGYNLDRIEVLRQKKAKERGGFAKRIILEETKT